MSGGYFDYQQYAISGIAESIDSVIRNNDNKEKDDFGQLLGRNYSKKTIDEFKRGRSLLRKAAIYAQRIDWLLSDDDGEDSFHQILKEEIDEYVRNKDNF